MTINDFFFYSSTVHFIFVFLSCIDFHIICLAACYSEQWQKTRRIKRYAEVAMLYIWLIVLKMQRLHHFLFHALLLLWQFSLHLLIVNSIWYMVVLVRSFIIYVVMWNMSILFSTIIHTTSYVAFTEYDPILLLSSYRNLSEKISS